MKIPTRAERPGWWLALEEWLSGISPANLPPVPWALSGSAPGVSMPPRGGTFLKVIDNERFLRHLKADLAEGPDGPRGHVIANDIQDLKAHLEKTSAHHGQAAN